MINKPADISQEAWDSFNEATKAAWERKAILKAQWDIATAECQKAIDKVHAAERAWREADDMFIGLYCQSIRP